MNPRAYWRFVIVVWQFLPLFLAYARDRRRFIIFGSSREVTGEMQRKRASALLDSLLTLGPTFIKLGQLLSTRPDILPPAYITEFSKLQDSVPPASYSSVRTVIEQDIGPVPEYYDEFETEAISGASLGQVYRAEVDGQQVAVKVRRPGVEDLVEADLRVIRWTLPAVRWLVDDARSFSLETLSDEFSKTIREEMDYEREAEMLREIRGNFEGNDDVRMPAVIDSHSTERVLTMEYVDGTKITDIERLRDAGHDLSDIAETLQRTYLQMIVEDGVFHADPHPGNLAIAEDGTLVFYDFGMSGYVDPFIQDRIVGFYSAIMRQDTDEILDAMVEMGTLSPKVDRQLMSDVLELAIEDLRGEDIDQYRVQSVISEIEDTVYEFPLRLPPNFALILRVATVVEGVCVTLDPDFDFIEVATSYLRQQGYIQENIRQYATDRASEAREAASAALSVPPKLDSVLRTIEYDDLHVEAELEDPHDFFDRLALRLVLGMTFAAGLVSTSILYASAGPVATAIAGVSTVFVAIVLYLTFRERSGPTAEPQFTRQNLREEDVDEELRERSLIDTASPADDEESEPDDDEGSDGDAPSASEESANDDSEPSDPKGDGSASGTNDSDGASGGTSIDVNEGSIDE